MFRVSLFLLIAGFALTQAGEAIANNNCGGLNQRVCKKWEQIRGCDPGLHRTSPIGGICTRDNKLIPNPIERVFRPPPQRAPAPAPQPPAAVPVQPSDNGYYTPPAPTQKKGALPHVSSIPPGQPTAMDGLWKLNVFSLPFKLEAGRMYSMSDYMHLLIFPVESYDVVVKDIVQVGPGQLSGYDLAAAGRWSTNLQADGSMKLTVNGALGPFEGVLTPIQISNPQWYAQELSAVSGGYRPPPVLPGPPADFPPPQPPLPPAGGGDVGYPPGWGQ